MKKLPHDFYQQDTMMLAQALLGKYLIHKIKDKEYTGRIVEVEAYLGAHDLAAHSSKGITERTKVMFGPPGYAYVYLIYGMYHCMNVVTEKEGHGAAILLRAVEPIKDIAMRTQGPGLLCKAMQIDKQLNAKSLLSDHFYIAESNDVDANNIDIVKKPRVGVDYAGVWAKKLLRFYVKGNAFISKK